MTTDLGQQVASAEGSAVPEPSAPSPLVNVGACRCPSRPHATDTVTLRTTVSVPMGMAAMQAMRGKAFEGGTPADSMGALASVYLHHAIAAWSFVDEKGKPVPITPANADRLLPFEDGGFEVADRADDILQEQITRPLVKRMALLSPDMPTPDSTSASPTNTASSTGAASSLPESQPEPSRPSSPTATDGTPSEDPAP